MRPTEIATRLLVLLKKAWHVKRCIRRDLFPNCQLDTDKPRRRCRCSTFPDGSVISSERVVAPAVAAAELPSGAKAAHAVKTGGLF